MFLVIFDHINHHQILSVIPKQCVSKYDFCDPQRVCDGKCCICGLLKSACVSVNAVSVVFEECVCVCKYSVCGL